MLRFMSPVKKLRSNKSGSDCDGPSSWLYYQRLHVQPTVEFKLTPVEAGLGPRSCTFCIQDESATTTGHAKGRIFH
jgi:hypothetical protein